MLLVHATHLRSVATSSPSPPIQDIPLNDASCFLTFSEAMETSGGERLSYLTCTIDLKGKGNEDCSCFIIEKKKNFQYFSIEIIYN